VSVDQFLKQSAVNIALGGRYMLPNWFDPQGKPRSFACRTSRISPFRMMVQVPVVGKVGDRLTTYFGDFGKLDGLISDTVPGGFLFELAISHAEREKLASKLTWLEKKQRDPAVRDQRSRPALSRRVRTRLSPSPMALPAAALSSTCRCRALRCRLMYSRRSERHWPWELASAASSGFSTLVLRSGSSNSRVSTVSNGASCDPHPCRFSAARS
jgi:hypothetical protein